MKLVVAALIPPFTSECRSDNQPNKVAIYKYKKNLLINSFQNEKSCNQNRKTLFFSQTVNKYNE